MPWEVPNQRMGGNDLPNPPPAITILRGIHAPGWLPGESLPAAHSEFGQGAMNRTRHPFCDFSSGKGVSVWGVGV